VEHYEQALRLQPDSAVTHANLGDALAQLGRTAEARDHYEAALRIEPNFADARHALARLPEPR
jgi:tetratricopeptide (TPR) repeat protein